MTKSARTLLSLLFAFCLLSPLIAQSQQAASWEQFDQLIASLRQEIDNLSLQIASLQNSLTLAQSDLAESLDELNQLKTKQAQLLIQLAEYERLSTQWNLSVKNYESQLKSSSLKLVASILANVVLTGGIIYMILH